MTQSTKFTSDSQKSTIAEATDYTGTTFPWRPLAQESRKKAPPSRRDERGMTLIEVMIVVAIIAMVSGGVAIVAIGQMTRARLTQAETDARQIRATVQTYFLTENTSDCPSMNDLLAANLLDDASKTTDPWGHEWAISCSYDRVTVSSTGPDGAPRTPDDISVPRKRAGTGKDEG